MDDERPPYKKYTMIAPPSAEENGPPPTETPMDENEEINAGKKSSTLIIVGALLVVALIIAGLFLPPISLGTRLGLGGNNETADAPVTAVADQPTIPSDIALSTNEANVSKLDAETGADALAALPANTAVQGDVYAINYEGDAPIGSAALNIPANSGPLSTLDLYGWDGSAWNFLPSRIDAAAQQIVSNEGPLPQVVAIMQTAVADAPAIGAELLPTQQLPVDILPQLTEVTAGTLTLVGNGQLQGELVAVPTGAYDQLLRVTNTGAVVDQASLTALLGDDAAQSAHINDLAARAGSGNYAGVNLDYQGVAANQAAAFSGFVADLAQALHGQGRSLAITLGVPQRVGDSWDTAGQDWAALGQAADIAYLQMPLNPTVYGDNGAADQLLSFATRQINRQKLTLLASANAVDNIGESFRELPNAAALANFGELQFVQGGTEVEPGTSVEAALSGTAGPLEWDGTSLAYKYSYEQSGQTHHVWLGNEAALAQRLRLANAHNLRGVAVRGLGNVSDGAGYAAALNNYLGAGEELQPTGAAIVWTALDADGSVLASSSGEALSFVWEGVETPGEYSINVDFALGDTVTELDSATVAVLEPPEPETVAETETSEETEEDAPADDADSTADAPTSGLNPGDADAVVNTGANVRIGPGLGYGTIAGGAQPGDNVQLIGRSSDSYWLNITMPDGQTEGWIFAELVNVNSDVDIASLPVPDIAPPVASSGGGDDDSGGSSPAPPPVTVPPVTNTGFELGGQAFGAPYGMMSYAGMNWIKRQHKWGPGNNGGDLAGTITDAHNAGFKILLSIPGAPYPSSMPDFGAYTTFLSQLASLPDPPDAIEVWNEMNIDAEWPVPHIDPASYVNNMLAPAYNAIKAANPNIMVVSGAPAPTGYFGSCSGAGCDDGLYMAGMGAAGGANYMDCIGIHYNEGIISPHQESGDPRTHHYTRYFWGMLNTYWNAFGGARPLCFTELGYLTSEGYDSLPGGFAWAGNVTVSQQAQWLAEAASLSASSGKVRMMIVWNIDSTTWGSDPQAGFAIIRPGGGCPACETLRSVMVQ
ncbi:MAG: SH3 domain-containing protein [Chloroflexi bacterium]|nr:SH3 domain-containing protein [Chloroflexota bacterium]